MGFPQSPGMVAISTTWGLKAPTARYVWVTVCSLEIRVPLLSPKSQLKLMSALPRYWLGSWSLMLKAMARFWMKFWSSWFMSLSWASDMLKGTWSDDRSKDVGMLWWGLLKVWVRNCWMGYLWQRRLRRRSREGWTCLCRGSDRWQPPCYRSPGGRCLYRWWGRRTVHLPPANNALEHSNNGIIYSKLVINAQQFNYTFWRPTRCHYTVNRMKLVHV